MDKNSTLKSFYQFNRTFPGIFLLCLVLMLSSAKADAVSSNSGIEIQAKNIKCYPNPAVSFVNFDLPSDYVNKKFSLQVFSFTGKKMYEWNVTNPKLTITFSNEFYRGIYIYQLRDSNGRIVETGKFQVNR